ncbi:MAG: hypothetical protein EBR59_08055, partial [Methylococcaceae bacterium]|nr:hypothetical protein [Methylococcaceae bacterium]
FNVSLNKTSTSAISFTPSLATVSATVGTDTGTGLDYFDGSHWVPVTSVVTIAAGSSSVLVRAAITPDTDYEGSETFTLSTGTISGTVTNSGPATGTGTIVDNGSSTNFFDANNNTATPSVGTADNDKPTVSVSNVTVSEAGNHAVFNVSLSNASTGTISFTPTLSDGTATVGTDTALTSSLEFSNDGGINWSTVSGPVTIAAGQTSVKLRIGITDDLVSEANETFTLSTGSITGDVNNPTGASGTATITDNDLVSSFSINDVTVNEGAGTATFTVTRSGATGAVAAVDFSTGNGSALASADFTSSSGSLNFAIGDTSKSVTVAITDDNIYESAENFFITLGSPSGAGISDGTGEATINDNDLAPGFSINDVTVNEGAGTATFTVTRSGATGAVASVSYTSSDGTATAGSDYSAATGTLNFGIGETSKTFTVAIINDSIFENSESFNISLSNPNGASITDGVGLATIKDDGTGAGGTDDDRPITVSSPTVNEASPYAFFTVDGEPTQSVNLSLADGTAGSADYGPSLEFSVDGGSSWSSYGGGSVNLSGPGGTLLVRTPVKQDITFENSEDFTLNVSRGSGSGVTGTATIRDDGTGTLFNANGTENLKLKKDDDRSLAVEDITVNEGSPYAVFRVSGVEGQQLQLSLEDNGSDFAPLQGHAQIGVDTSTQLQYFNGNQWADYAAGSKITYPKGSTTLLMRVALVNDKVFEKQESFKLKAVAGSLSAYGTGIISDDGQGPIFNESGSENPTAVKDDDRVLRIDSFDVNEGSGYAVFTVTAAANSQLELALVSTGSGSGNAALGIDTGSQLQYYQQGVWQNYSAGSKVAVGDGPLFVRVAIVNDTDKEGPETFRLLASDSALGSTFGTATIKDEGTGSVWLGNNTQAASAAELTAAKFILDDDFDLDGIPPNVEEILATMSSSTGNGGSNGDLNNDGEQDAQQNSVATLAWIKEENFQKAIEGTLTEVKPIINVEVKSTQNPDIAGDSQFQLSDINVVKQSASEFGGKAIDQTLTKTGETIQAPWDPIQFKVTPVDTISDKKLDDADPNRDGTQIKVAIDIQR